RFTRAAAAPGRGVSAPRGPPAVLRSRDRRTEEVMARRRYTPLRELLIHRWQLEDPVAAILAGHVLVDGRIVTNPRSLVRSDAAVVVRGPQPLRGEAQLRAPPPGLDVPVPRRLALHLRAAPG